MKLQLNNLSEIVQHLHRKGDVSRHSDFKNLIENLPFKAVTTISNVKDALDFACEQYAAWLTKFLFSSIYSPDNDAQKEAEEWKVYFESFKSTIVQSAPDAQTLTEEATNLKILGHVLKRRIEHNKTRPYERYFCKICSSASIKLNKFGFKSLSSWLYNKSLYPKDTIGRAGRY